MSSGCDESEGPDEGVEESVGSSWVSKAPKSQAKSRKSSTTGEPDQDADHGTARASTMRGRRRRWRRGGGQDLGAVGRGAVGGQRETESAGGASRSR